VVDVDDFKSTSAFNGWWFWAGWCVLSLLLLIFKRYLKPFWLIGIVLHCLIGLIITGITIYFSLKALQHISWKIISVKLHTIDGLLVFAIIVPLGGLGVAYLLVTWLKRDRKRWISDRGLHNKIGSVHKCMGWFTIVVGFLSCSSGLMKFQDWFNHYDKNIVWPIANGLLFAGLLIFCEILYLCWNKFGRRKMSFKRNMR
jgi:drug/metabolite transporter (DMT)-like permease